MKSVHFFKHFYISFNDDENNHTQQTNNRTPTSISGADPGFLERGRLYIFKGAGVRFAEFISFFLNISVKMGYHVIFKNGGGGGVRSTSTSLFYRLTLFILANSKQVL